MALECYRSLFQPWMLRVSVASLAVLSCFLTSLYHRMLFDTTSDAHTKIAPTPNQPHHYVNTLHDIFTLRQHQGPNSTSEASGNCNSLFCNHEFVEPLNPGNTTHALGRHQRNNREDVDEGRTRPRGRAGSGRLHHSSPVEDRKLEEKKDEDKVVNHRPRARTQPQHLSNLLVILWTPFWLRRDLWEKTVQQRGRLRASGCPTWRCEFVWSWEEAVRRAPEAAAFVFFGMNFYEVPPPPRRAHQLWLWMDREAPPISELSSTAWARAESEGIFFNLSMSYHRLSDVVLHDGDLVPLSSPAGAPYEPRLLVDTTDDTFLLYKDHMHTYDLEVKGRLRKMLDIWLREQAQPVWNNETNMNSYSSGDTWTVGEKEASNTGDNSSKWETAFRKVKKEPLDTTDKELERSPWHSFYTQEEIAMAKRPKLAAWMASHCPTDSRRESVVAALQRHIVVTTVGKCGKLSCGRNHEDTYCYRWLASSHLFYLSFENALCDDYVTEKLWRPLEHGMVPVVYGGTRYTDILPFGSFINAADFQSAADLARHLAYLGNHPTAYLRHLQWRRFWRVRWPTPWCNLCSRLHRQQATPSLVTLDAWWNSTATCYEPFNW